MEVILLERIRNLGKVGDIVSVKPGFARNFLVPSQKAKIATKQNLEAFEAMRKELEAKDAADLAEAKNFGEKVSALALQITVRVSEENRLYGSVTTREVVLAAAEQGVEITANDIDMPNGPIHELGDFEVNVHCHMEIIVPLRITVIAQDEAK